MHFSELPESAHALVALRPVERADLAAWYDYLSLPVVFEHTSWNIQSAADLTPFVWAPEACTPSSPLRLAIVLRSNNQLVGTVGFHTVSPENRSAEIAYDLAPALWGQGIATHLCRRLVEWAHAQAGLVRVQATVLASNERSARVLQRCGFQREGLLRSYRQVRGQAGDFWMYAHVAP
ncbi:MAG: GNAT family N-acetyltransferase [Leptothrix sp. (in: b-proteobacteria)]